MGGLDERSRCFKERTNEDKTNMIDNDLCWYVAYGSNINVGRFYSYIFGGVTKYTEKYQKGCRIKKNPMRQTTTNICHELYFSNSSRTWEDKGVAFVKTAEDQSKKTLCTSYLIQKEQFIDIFLQENDKYPFTEELDIDFASITDTKELLVFLENDYSWYGRIIYLGKYEGFPAFTFTAKWDDDHIVCSVPGNKYLKTIIEGIKANYNYSGKEISDYLLDICGIQGNIKREEIENLIQSEN